MILSNKFIIFEINNYVRFEVHRQWFQSILLALFQRNRISATRTGIRYINIFDTSRIKLQKKYFTSEVASSLQVKLVEEENRPRLIRSMHMAEYRIDEMTMNFRYGMFNPEYPNFLKKNDFALDFDFFSNDIIDSADGIFHVIDKGHYEIQVLFERSITDSLREVMER